MAEKVYPEEIVERFKEAVGNCHIVSIVIVAETYDPEADEPLIHVHQDTVSGKWRHVGMLECALIDCKVDWERAMKDKDD